MIGWIADLLRLVWGFGYWNTQKTLFRLRRGRMRCPCQSPSDSGRALETTCEASLTWDRQERFQRLCPLLKRDARGQLRCSVNTEDVRPFWGRAFAYVGGSLLGLYLIATLLAFGTLRVVGYELNYFTLAWPPAWKSLPAVRSQYYTKKARRALASNNVNEAVISLSVAYELDPKNYAAAYTLAELWKTTQPALADHVYTQLLQDHPDRRVATLSAWYQALLLRGDFKPIPLLASDALKVDPPHANLWMDAIFFALHREPNDELLRKLSNDPALPPGAATLFKWELDTRPPPDLDKRLLLVREPEPPLHPYVHFYRSHRLIEMGYPSDALALIQRPGYPLPKPDKINLELEAYAALGWRSVLKERFDKLVAPPLDVVTVENISAFLIRHPDHELLDLVFASWQAHPLPVADASYSACVSLLCAAGAAGDKARVHQMAEVVRQIAHNDFRVLASVEDFFGQPAPEHRIETFLPVLQPLPLAVNYALLERYYRPRVAVPSPR